MRKMMGKIAKFNYKVGNMAKMGNRRLLHCIGTPSKGKMGEVTRFVPGSRHGLCKRHLPIAAPFWSDSLNFLAKNTDEEG